MWSRYRQKHSWGFKTGVKQTDYADLMKLLFLKFNTVNSTLKELRLLVICALSYTGFLRYDELSNIKANNITFYEEYVDICIEKSKTDCYRNGKNALIAIAKLNTPQCPVTILQCYIREAKIDLRTDKYILRPLTYFKRNKNYMRNNKIKFLTPVQEWHRHWHMMTENACNFL